MSLLTPKKRVLFVHRLALVLLLIFSVFSILAYNLRSPSKVVAAASSTINFQARLQTAAGAIVPDGNYNVEFKLYNSPNVVATPDQGACTRNGGTAEPTCLWTETRTTTNQVRVVNGYLTVSLGSVTAFPSINWNQQLWLSMNIGGTPTTPTWDGEMTPRLLLTAVPYAFAAGQLTQANSGSTLFSTLNLQAPTGGNQSFMIQDQGAAGTYNILTAPSGSDGYVKLQGTTPGTQQSGNLNISGTVQGGVGIFQPAVGSDSTSEFNVRTSAGNNLLTVDSVNSRVGIALGSTNTPTLQGSGLEINGALRLSGGSNTGAVDNYITPLGTALAVKINIPTYDPTSYNPIIALGISRCHDPTETNATCTTSGYSSSLARGIVVVDGRTSSHQPTIGILSPNEAQIFGLSYEGSNTNAYIKASNATITLQANATNILSVTSSSSSAGTVAIGSAGTVQGNLSFANSTNSNTVTVASGTTSGSYTIQLPAAIGSAGQCLSVGSVASGTQTLGYASCATTGSFVTLQGTSPGTPDTGNLNITGVGVFGGGLQSQSLDTSASGSLSIGTTFASSINIGRNAIPTTINGTLIATQLLTANGGITIGNSPGSGTQLLNNGSTVNTVYPVANLPTGGSIGTAASTVDIYTAISIAQTTSGQTITLPNPTANTAYGTVLYVTNNGSTPFTLSGTPVNNLGLPLKNGSTATLIWANTSGGASWTYAGADGSSILNQSASVQSASFNISGSGTFGTATTTVQFTATGQSILGGGTNQQQVIIKANASQSATTPLLVLTSSSGTELARFSADNASDLFIGNSAGAAVSGATQFNTFIGGSSGVLDTSGKKNTALGYQSLNANTVNDNNTAIGTNALLKSDAGGNTAVGSSAGSNITSGYENTALGDGALQSIITGTYNTALGSNAGLTDFYGNFSTLSNLQNASAVGAYSQVQSSNSLVLGSVDNSTKVGIGTTMPTNLLSVSPVFYGTGSSTTIKASQSGNTVTGTGTTFTSAMVGLQFIFANGSSGTVTAYTSATSLTLSTSQTVASQAFRIQLGGFQVTTSGTAFVQSSSTTAFQIQNNAGTSLFTADTTNSQFTLAGSTLNATNFTFAGAGTISATGTNALTLNTTGAGTIAIGITNTTTINIGNNALSHTINIGNITGGTTTIAGVSVVINATSGGSVQIGSATTDTTPIKLQTDSYSTYAETSLGTCNSTTNQGALYFNTASSSLRTCTGTTGWQDVVSSDELGLILFGIVPDGSSGANIGDLPAASGYNTGPCKVYLSAAAVVSWNACNAYTNGRKIVISAGSATVSTSTSMYQNLCVFTAGSAPTLGTAGTDITAALPNWSTSAPVLCLATVLTGTTASTVAAIYDTRVYISDTKQFVTLASAASIGTMLKSNGSAGQYTPVAATGDAALGVLVSYSGTTSTNAPNGIIVTQGPVAVKATAGTIGQILQSNGAATGYSTTASGAILSSIYGNFGIAQTAYSASGTSCTASTACYGSIFTVLNIR